MHSFVNQLREGLRRCQIADQRLVVGVSGGADSVALLRGLIDVSQEFSLKLMVAHLNHQLRGVESDADAEWVRSLASSFGLPSEIGCVSAGELSADDGGLEENARTVRYRFLDGAARKFDCHRIVLAHTADDQAETVLHHLLRGSGVAGLGGIRSLRTTVAGNWIVRPMLGIRRTEIESYLDECGQVFRTDATNRDTTMTRNWLRHDLLPMLRERINPQVDAALCRLAEQAAEIDDVLTMAATALLARSAKDCQPDACRLDIHELTNQPRHLVREVFRELWQQQQWPLQAMGYEQWNRLVDVLTTRETITLPGRIEARFHSETLLVLRQL